MYVYMYMIICVCVCIFVCVYVYLCACLRAFIYVGTCRHMRRSINLYMHICRWACLHMCMHMSLRMHIHMCTHGYVYTWTSVYMYTCIYIYIFLFHPVEEARSLAPGRSGTLSIRTSTHDGQESAKFGRIGQIRMLGFFRPGSLAADGCIRTSRAHCDNITVAGLDRARA